MILTHRYETFKEAFKCMSEIFFFGGRGAGSIFEESFVSPTQ